MGKWYARPVLFVADVQRAVDFYVGKLGFTENWRFGDEVARIEIAVVREDRAADRRQAGFGDDRQRAGRDDHARTEQ